MAVRKIAELVRDFEEKTGAPPLSKFLETVERLPDEKRLKAIREVLDAAYKVAQSGPELNEVIALIQEVNSIPPDRLKELEKVLKRIEGIMKKAPEELLGFLKSLKEE